ncbi:MAG TPA: hypothetical protein VGB50_13685 [Flavobacterium sp.]|jgi:hypothetical protein
MENFDDKIKKSTILNLAVEAGIKESRTINAEQLFVFRNWLEDDSASTIGFLVRKLALIRTILEAGNSVTIMEEPVRVLTNESQLRDWIGSAFNEHLIGKVMNYQFKT